jgi:hypothetical protein
MNLPILMFHYLRVQTYRGTLNQRLANRINILLCSEKYHAALRCLKKLILIIPFDSRCELLRINLESALEILMKYHSINPGLDSQMHSVRERGE